MSPFAIGSLSGVVLVVVLGALTRGRFFATFAAVVLTVQALLAIGLYPLFEPIWPVFVYLQVATQLHFLSLSRPRMRPLVWRAAVSAPGLFFAAGCFLALPWAVLAALGFEPWGAELAFVVAGFGLAQSLFTREEEVDLRLHDTPAEARPAAVAKRPVHEVVPEVVHKVVQNKVVRHPRGAALPHRPLRIVQITDPHLGPLMSVDRLRRICERAVAREPDLILLTGDFLTMESQADPRVLEDALAPLAAASGKTFACMGNHDHEAPELVARALAACGITLLIDEEAVVETPAGSVSLIGADFVFRKRREHLAALSEAYPPREEHLRILMLHDPGAFRHVPHGHGDLVLSGHTHGGQLGLLSLGLAWTFVSAFTPIPDHGFWARGTDRLYVHRGTGVYGFPLRIGVPAEQSLLRIHRAR